MTYTYDVPPEVQVESDGPIRIVRLNRPDALNASNHVLHKGSANVFLQLDAEPEAGAAVITGDGRAFSAGGDFDYLGNLTTDPEQGFASGTRCARVALPASDEQSQGVR